MRQEIVVPMKLAGFLLLPAGWIVLIFAVAVFSSHAAIAVVVVAGLLIQILGLVLIVRQRHIPTGGPQ
jgi:hypothetical protein